MIFENSPILNTRGPFRALEWGRDRSDLGLTRRIEPPVRGESTAFSEVREKPATAHSNDSMGEIARLGSRRARSRCRKNSERKVRPGRITRSWNGSVHPLETRMSDSKPLEEATESPVFFDVAQPAMVKQGKGHIQEGRNIIGDATNRFSSSLCPSLSWPHGLSGARPWLLWPLGHLCC